MQTLTAGQEDVGYSSAPRTQLRPWPALVRVPVPSHDHGLRVELRRDLIRYLVQEPHPVHGRVLLGVEAERVSALEPVVRLPVLVDVGGGQEGSCKAKVCSIVNGFFG